MVAVNTSVPQIRSLDNGHLPLHGACTNAAASSRCPVSPRGKDGASEGFASLTNAACSPAVVEAIASRPAHSAIDIFDQDVLEDPWSTYRQLRSLGPVVYLKSLGIYALPRYEDVKFALKHPELFRNGGGVAFNDAMNASQKKTILGSDAPDHAALRRVLTPLFTGRALGAHAERIAAVAKELVAAVVDAGTIDSVSTLAQQLPMQVSMDLLGLPKQGRRRHMTSADMNFNAFGPVNPRILADLRRLDVYIGNMEEVAEQLAPDSIGADVMAAVGEGQITREQGIGLLQSIILGSLDTTGRSLTTVLYYLATDPSLWAALRSEPTLIPAAYNEILRLDGPSLAMARTTQADVVIHGQLIPRRSRIALMLASANRDERRWRDPDRLDIHRQDANEHVTFGHGIHYCIGHVLARMQAHALIGALLEQVAQITLADTPRRRLSSVVRGFEHLPLQLHKHHHSLASRTLQAA